MKYLRLQKFSVRSRGSATAAATATRTRHACLSSLVVARKNGSALAPTHVCHARAEFEDTEKSQQQESSMNQDNSMVSLFFSSFLFYKVKVTDGKTKKKTGAFFVHFVVFRLVSKSDESSSLEVRHVLAAAASAELEREKPRRLNKRILSRIERPVSSPCNCCVCSICCERERERGKKEREARTLSPEKRRWWSLPLPGEEEVSKRHFPSALQDRARRATEGRWLVARTRSLGHCQGAAAQVQDRWRRGRNLGV